MSLQWRSQLLQSKDGWQPQAWNRKAESKLGDGSDRVMDVVLDPVHTLFLNILYPGAGYH